VWSDDRQLTHQRRVKTLGIRPLALNRTQLRPGRRCAESGCSGRPSSSPRRGLFLFGEHVSHSSALHRRFRTKPNKGKNQCANPLSAKQLPFAHNRHANALHATGALVAVTPARSTNTYRSTLRRVDQAAGAADATRKPRSIAGVGCGSQEVSCDPLPPDHAGGAPAA
jgi:hypothetical protein